MALLVLFLPAFFEAGKRYDESQQQDSLKLATLSNELNNLKDANKKRIIMPDGSEAPPVSESVASIAQKRNVFWGWQATLATASISLLLIGLFFQYHPQVAVALSGDTLTASPVILRGIDPADPSSMFTVYNFNGIPTVGPANVAICLTIPNHTNHPIRIVRIAVEIRRGWFGWSSLVRVPGDTINRMIFYGPRNAASRLSPKWDLESLAQSEIMPGHSIQGFALYNFTDDNVPTEYPNPSTTVWPMHVVITDSDGHSRIADIVGDSSQSGLMRCTQETYGPPQDFTSYETRWDRSAGEFSVPQSMPVPHAQ